MPKAVRKEAIKFAREITGLERPHRSQTVYIDAFEKCYNAMVELGMVKREFADGEKEDSDRKEG